MLQEAVATAQDVSRWKHLRGVPVPDQDCSVELLIDQDVPYSLIPLEVRVGGGGAPFAVRTRLGWTVTGPVGYQMAPNATECLTIRSNEVLETHLERQVRLLSELEGDHSRGDGSVALSLEDKKMLEMWTLYGTRVGNHYQFPVPFRKEYPDLPNNKAMAEQQLKSLKGRLTKNTRLYQRYAEEMKQLLCKDYAELVPASQLTANPGKTWFLPHLPVLNPKKPDKILIVFDCASVYANTSLNSQVLQGPDLNNKLLGILIRFPQGRTAIMADIEVMFHQIRVTPEHRGALRFLWWDSEDLTHAPRLYRMKVHLFEGCRVTWDLESDQFAVKTQVQRKPATKRGLLSVVSSVYDPLGFIAPFVIKAKLLFQDECRRRRGWDEPLLEHNNVAWNAWFEKLPRLATLGVPRFYKPRDHGRTVSVQLHSFCDASQVAYGLASYLRLTDTEGNIHCSFIFGKAKLAHLKQQTTLRLELSAAVLAVNADQMIRQELELKVEESFFWTDNMLILQYIANISRRFHTFVANRVAVIQELSETNHWRPVNTSLNPVIDATRGLSVEEMTDGGRWIQGPDFLRKGEEHWPERLKLTMDLSGEVEVKRNISVLTTSSATTTPTQEVQALWARCSSWLRLLKGVALQRRFAKWLREGRDQRRDMQRGLHVAELERAKLSFYAQCKRNGIRTT
ncbi:uncharacterized protein LOC121873355 [Homarus americanus]|uniref:uncharacterized protein LOC121871597 n=1 Tax=Homarus americanus TaxID=6706 RepID=UPI001C44F6DA|nr:uncharacterized protein LOC121871597 [Homarus americanus]XP_042232840.1 uncharacterized protein LOC121873355 [Homarus americanus]